MKHWIYPSDIVLSQLQGLALSNPAVSLIPSEKVVFNPHSDTSKKVALVSGGGAGHEPLHAGFVGTGLLDAAVSGAIFASPSTRQILAAIRTKSDKKRGSLVIVKNYTGDILHFGLAVERAKADGYNINMLVVGDDVAVGRDQNAMVGRRGLAGTAIVHKVLGSAAEHGLSLEDLHSLGTSLVENLITMSASLDRTSVPGRTDETEFTAPDEAELGLGIHNEPGTAIKIPSIDSLVDQLYEKLLGDDPQRHYATFDENDDYVLVVNNIGGTSSLEMNAITSYAVAQCPLKRKPKRVLVSDFVTSLSAPGFSLTLLNLSRLDPSTLKYLDAPTNAPGWKPKVISDDLWSAKRDLNVESPMKDELAITSKLRVDPGHFEQGLRGAIARLLKEESKITKYDTLVGDGDCGETLAAGANSILKELEDPVFKKSLEDPVATISRITALVESSMGGTSGGLYAIYLTALSHSLQKEDSLSTKSLANALHAALYDGLFKYTKARIGGRTLVDTLQPFVDTLKDSEDWDKAKTAAKKGCDSTGALSAKFGRASYVDDDQLHGSNGDIPDPGAVGLLALIEGFFEKDQ